MRKLFTIAVIAAFVGGVAVAHADEYVKGGFEMSGHVNAGASYQHFGQNAASTVLSGLGGNSGPVVAHGPQGELSEQVVSTGGGIYLTGHDSVLFYIDDAELDAMKSFGENIRTRLDIAVGRLASGSGAAFNVEQAYATANIPVGNGIEFLIGRFDAPIGFENVERYENDLFSHSMIFNSLRPQELTGVKIYYPFSDMVDWHLYIVNDLQDALVTTLPSLGTRVGFNWGEEGKKSTIGVSLAGGPEVAKAASKFDRITYLADVDWNVWIGESFSIGGEGIYRNDNAAGGATDGRYFAGQLNLHYVFNDVWDGTLRYAYGRQNAGAATALGAGGLLDATNAGFKSQIHEFTLGGQYQIADGAKIQMEYRLDMITSVTGSVTGTGRGMTHGGLVNFAYTF